jgi:hypothetical protein
VAARQWLGRQHDVEGIGGDTEAVLEVIQERRPERC